MITKEALMSLREQIQEDLLTFLDGMDNEILDGICEIIVKNFTNLNQ